MSYFQYGTEYNPIIGKCKRDGMGDLGKVWQQILVSDCKVKVMSTQHKLFPVSLQFAQDSFYKSIATLGLAFLTYIYTTRHDDNERGAISRFSAQYQMHCALKHCINII